MACILIAHENSDIRELFAFLLSEYNQTIAAESGLQAINLFDKYRPNIVIIHTSLPEISGYEVVKHIRATDLSAKIIATSSNCAGAYSNRSILQAGADSCISTPVDLNILVAVVQSMVESQNSSNYKETTYNQVTSGRRFKDDCSDSTI